MTTQAELLEVRKAVQQKLFKEINEQKEVIKSLYYAKARWAYEREYEDFEEYIKYAKEAFKKTNFEVISMNKQFKITLKHKVGTYCELKLGAKSYSFGVK